MNTKNESDFEKDFFKIFWFGYQRPNYGENVKLCFIYTDSFIVHVKTDDI